MDLNSSIDSQRKFILTLILSGAGLLLFCLVASAGWLFLQGRGQTPQITRTALVAAFGTPQPGQTTLPPVTEEPADTPVASASTNTPVLLPEVTREVTPTPQVEPTWSEPPQGHIVFACFVEGNDDICLMNADGTNVKRLTKDPATDFYPSISPDGQTIVFLTAGWEF
jgi:hypothetical protein